MDPESKPPERGIRLDEHHERIAAALKQAEADVLDAQAGLRAAEGRVKYYQGQLDLLVEFVQFAQPQPKQDPVS
jgi:hypothetical protein